MDPNESNRTPGDWPIFQPSIFAQPEPSSPSLTCPPRTANNVEAIDTPRRRDTSDFTLNSDLTVTVDFSGVSLAALGPRPRRCAPGAGSLFPREGEPSPPHG
jgi:hypothetical protein